jgi:hypothetical protein
MSIAGFKTVLIIEALSTERSEIEKILSTFRSAGYKVRLTAAPDGVDGDRVYGGRWMLSSDVRSVSAPAPKESQASGTSSETPEDTTEN